MKKIIIIIFILNFLKAYDICYDTAYHNCTFGGGVGPCVGGVDCTITYPLKNISGEILKNIKIYYNETGFNGSFGGNCSQNPSGECNTVYDINFGPFGFFNSATEYIFNENMNPNDEFDISVSSLVSMKCFYGDRLYAEYDKNGTHYQVKIYPCSEVNVENIDILLNQCDLFTNVLQTRHDNSKIKMKSNGNVGFLENTNSNLLNTTYVFSDNYHHGLIWDKNKNRQFDNGEKMAQATGKLGKDLNESTIFTWNFQDSKASEDVGNTFNSYEVRQENEILTDNKYNRIYQDSNHYNFTWKPNRADIGVRKFDEIKGVVNIDNIAGKDVKIGQFITTDYGDTKLIFKQLPESIQIGKLSVSGSNKFSAEFNASGYIDITEFDVKSSENNTIILRAPIVRIAKENDNKMNLDNDNNHIIIYADILYIGEIDFGQHNTLEIHPFTPGEKVNVHIRQINFSSSSSIIMDSGNYYIKDVDIPGSGQNIALMRASDENQIINLILDPASENHDFEIGNNFGINSHGIDGDYGNYNPANFKIFVNGDLKTGGGGTTINALVYVTGKVELGSPTYVRGAISSGDDIIIGNNSEFYWDDRLSSLPFAQKCENNSCINFRFDAYNKIINNTRRITTQVVNDPFNLTVVSFDENGNETNFSGTVCIRIKGSGYKSKWIKKYWQNNKEIIYSNISIDRALKQARVKIKWYIDKNVSCKETNETNITFSSDYFAIRPYAFKIFGNNQYKKAGEDFNITIKTVDKNNNFINLGKVDNVVGVKNYNEPLSNLKITSKFYVPTPTELAQMRTDTGENNVSYCPDSGVFEIVGNPYFINGEVNATLKFSETGVLEINVSEKRGSEFAKVDEKDTPDSQRYIKSATTIYDVNDINKTDLLMFIPYKFQTFGYVDTIPYNPNNWVYMSNDVKKLNITNTIPKMAGVIVYNIKAYNKDGRLLKNYTKTCFPDVSDNAPKRNGLKLNTTFDLFLDTDLNITKKASVSAFTVDNNDNAIWTLNKEINFTKGKNLLKEWISSINFENGEGNAKVYFNINKNYKIQIGEINITINDINTSTSWMNNLGATNIFIGKNINKTIKFLYGRIKTNEATGIGSEINTTFKYEYWDNNKGWIENKEHNETYGKVYFNQSYINSTKLPNSKISFNKENITNGEQKVIFRTTHSLPYGAKIHLSIDSWLWYHPLAKDYKEPSTDNLDCLTHPCIKVNFLTNSSAWGGISAINNIDFNESNRTVKVNNSQEKNVSKKEVKKINW